MRRRAPSNQAEPPERPTGPVDLFDEAGRDVPTTPAVKNAAAAARQCLAVLERLTELEAFMAVSLASAALELATGRPRATDSRQAPARRPIQACQATRGVGNRPIAPNRLWGN